MMMSRVASLNEGYRGFFLSTGVFYISPFLLTFKLAELLTLNTQDSEGRSAQIMKNACYLGIVLTVIPVLPIASLLTAGLAFIGAVLAGLSMLIAYPVAAILDCTFPDPRGVEFN